LTIGDAAGLFCDSGPAAGQIQEPWLNHSLIGCYEATNDYEDDTSVGSLSTALLLSLQAGQDDDK
jgi:hypothetical protein